jgi:hypothetical protein
MLDDSFQYDQGSTPFSNEMSNGSDHLNGVSDPVNQRMLLALVSALLTALLFIFVLPDSNISEASSQSQASTLSNNSKDLAPKENELVNNKGVEDANGQVGIGPAMEPEQSVSLDGKISPVFTPEVQYWESKILEWSKLYGVDPNMAAIIMQVESCGDPGAESYAGAQSLFQVMPFHFTAGENMQDPDTNARRGLNYFRDGMNMTNGDVGRSFAGYNGGHGTAAKSWDNWPNETQRYFYWTTGIYEDIQAGLTESPRLQEWLAAGGSGLCAQAAARLGF